MEGYEIERKFLIKKLPYTSDELSDFEIWEIEQTYISEPANSRIRKINNNKYIITTKNDVAGSSDIREENESEITMEKYELHLKKKIGNTIFKSRYKIPYGKFTIELDKYGEQLEGLIVAEVEFDSLEDAQSFIPPSWFDKEVTSDKSYRNSSLAKNGFPKAHSIRDIHSSTVKEH